MGVGGPQFNPVTNNPIQSSGGSESGKVHIKNPETQSVLQSLGFSQSATQVNVTKGIADTMMLKVIEFSAQVLLSSRHQSSHLTIAQRHPSIII